MKTNFIIPGSQLDRAIKYSDAEKIERRALGLPACEPAPAGLIKQLPKRRKVVSKKAITEPKVLNEASTYGAAFVRGLRVDLPGGVTHLLFSGTASIGPNGETLYVGDFRAQLWRTFHNLTACLPAKAPPGTTSCAPPVISATSSATTANSTPSATSFSTRWDWTRSPPAPASRRGFAGAICSLRSKP